MARGNRIACDAPLSCAGVLPSRAAFMHQQPPIRFVHPDRSNRRGHKNRKHCNREHKLSARQTETQRNRPDRRVRLLSADRRSHRTAALFIQLRPCIHKNTLLHETGAAIPIIKSALAPALAVYRISTAAPTNTNSTTSAASQSLPNFSNALRNLRHTFCLQHARHAHNR